MSHEGSGGQPQQLADNIFLLPGRKGGGCNVYVLKGSRKNLLIDVGLPQDYAAICAGLAEIGMSMDDIHMVILTHEHVDHVGGLPCLPGRILVAAHARAATKFALDDEASMMSGAFEAGKGTIHVDLHLEDGALIDIGGLRLRVIYTPGHSSGSICLHELEHGTLFSGDTLFAGGILGGIFASGNIADYIDSLGRLREYRLNAAYPGHGRTSNAVLADLDRAIVGSRQLMNDTQSLFNSVNAKTSFERIMSATVDYSRRAAERRGDRRVAGEIAALVRLDDADHVVNIRNISLSGASLDRVLPVRAEAEVDMVIDGIGRLTATVLAEVDSRTRLRFSRDLPCREELATWLAQKQERSPQRGRK